MKSLLFRIDGQKFEILRAGRMLIIISVFLFFLTQNGLPTYNPNVRNPVSSSTAPAGSSRSGLIRSPSPFDTRGNDLITGDVRGGKQFRGFVPYRSTTRVGVDLPSASISDFIRDSAGVEDMRTYPERYNQTQPFYYPSQTVTFTRPGYNRIFTSTDASAIDRDDTSTMGGFRWPAGTMGSVTGYTTFEGSLPMSRSLAEMERLISTDVGRYTEQVKGIGETSTSSVESRSRTETAQASSDSRGSYVSGLAASLEKISTSDGVSTTKESAKEPKARASEALFPHQYADELKSYKESRQAVITQQAAEWEALPEEAAQTTSLQEKETADTQAGTGAYIYEQVKKRVGNLQKSIENLPVADTSKLVTASEGAKEAISDEELVSRQGEVQYKDFDARLRSYLSAAVIEQPEVSKKQSDELSDTDLLTRAKRAAKQYAEVTPPQGIASLQGVSLESFMENKYKQYIEAGEIYLKQGRYYWAVNAYTLALHYKSDDPVAHAGKSYALFAAGEYISSALFLSRALDISPEYAKTSVDLVTILGGRDNLDKRIADAEEWLRNSNAVEMQFLLGYVYYQIGELAKAKEMINAAHARVPDAKAIGAVKKAIDDATAASAGG